MATTQAVDRPRRPQQQGQQPPKRQPVNGLWTEAELRDLFAQYQTHIQTLCTPWLPADQLLTMTMTCFARDAKLRRCTGDSIITALFKAARAGLAPGTVEAVLLPYGDQCTFIEQYQGVLFALYRTRRIERAFAEVVFERDTFDLDYGRAQVLIHKPHRANRGNPQGAYGYILLKGAREPVVHYMHPDDLDRVRKRSRAGEQSPWASDPNEMKRKTAMKNVSKYVQLGRHLDALLEDDLHALVGRDDAQLRDNISLLFGDRPALPAQSSGVVVEWAPEEPEPLPVQRTPHESAAPVRQGVNPETGEIHDEEPRGQASFNYSDSAAMDAELTED